MIMIALFRRLRNAKQTVQANDKNTPDEKTRKIQIRRYNLIHYKVLVIITNMMTFNNSILIMSNNSLHIKYVL